MTIPESIIAWLSFIAVAITVIVLLVYNSAIQQFDGNYETLGLEVQLIPLTGEGIPNKGNFPEWVPSHWGNTLGTSPRFYLVSDECETYSLPAGATGVYALTERFNPESIEVSVPQYDTGKVNVCRSTPGPVEVLLWARITVKK